MDRNQPLIISERSTDQLNSITSSLTADFLEKTAPPPPAKNKSVKILQVVGLPTIIDYDS